MSRTGNGRKEGELTPQESRFAVLVTQGMSQTAAYRVAYDKPRVKGNTASSRASDIARMPRVAAYIKELYRARKKNDLMSSAEWLAGCISDLENARSRNADTAVASLQRVIAQGLGELSETLTVDNRMTDEQLLEQLAGTNPEAAAMIKRLISGKQAFDA